MEYDYPVQNLVVQTWKQIKKIENWHTKITQTELQLKGSSAEKNAAMDLERLSLN